MKLQNSVHLYRRGRKFTLLRQQFPYTAFHSKSSTAPSAPPAECATLQEICIGDIYYHKQIAGPGIVLRVWVYHGSAQGWVRVRQHNEPHPNVRAFPHVRLAILAKNYWGDGPAWKTSLKTKAARLVGKEYRAGQRASKVRRIMDINSPRREVRVVSTSELNERDIEEVPDSEPERVAAAAGKHAHRARADASPLAGEVGETDEEEIPDSEPERMATAALRQRHRVQGGRD